MKAPKGNATVTSSNAHIANEKAHIVNSLNFDKIQKIKINPDIARSALDFYLNNPSAPYSEELSKGNSKQLIYTINHLYDVKINSFKAVHGINRSDQIRQALSAWLINENLLKLDEN